MIPLAILGLGSALPRRVVTNEEFEAVSGFPAARVEELFEIRERRWSRGVEGPDPVSGQFCSDLAIEAATNALNDAGVPPSDLGAILAVTTTPDSLNPPLDALVARGLGALGIPAMTIHAPCTGPFRAVQMAQALAPGLDARPVLVVAAETPSPFFRFGPQIPTEQILNSALYADGAGALVVAGSTGGRHPKIEAIDLLVNGDASEPGITFPGMLSAMPPTPERFDEIAYLGHHDFRRVLRRGSKLAADAARKVLQDLGIDAADVRYFLTHQATGNLRRIAASHGFPPEKVPVNIDRVGNTISASILILLDELSKGGSLTSGDLLVLHTAESSTWSRAGMVVRW